MGLLTSGLQWTRFPLSRERDWDCRDSIRVIGCILGLCRENDHSVNMCPGGFTVAPPKKDRPTKMAKCPDRNLLSYTI